MKKKVCPHCNKEKPISEFWRNKRTKDGLQNWCISCLKEKRSEPDFVEEQKVYLREWRKQNPGYSGEYYRENRDRIKKYEKGKRKIRTRARRELYKTEHGRYIILAANRRYRARKKGVPGMHTEEEINFLLGLSDHRCANCGSITDLEIDHIVPLSSGGCNCIHNLQVLCRSCNSAKGNRNSSDFRSAETLNFFSSFLSKKDHDFSHIKIEGADVCSHSM